MEQVGELMDEVINFRKSKQIKILLKKSCEKELTNLMNVEMDIVKTELKLIDPSQMVKIPTIDDDSSDKLNALLQDFKDVIEAKKFL